MCDWSPPDRARLDREAARWFAEKAEAYVRWIPRRAAGGAAPPGGPRPGNGSRVGGVRIAAPR